MTGRTPAKMMLKSPSLTITPVYLTIRKICASNNTVNDIIAQHIRGKIMNRTMTKAHGTICVLFVPRAFVLGLWKVMENTFGEEVQKAFGHMATRLQRHSW